MQSCAQLQVSIAHMPLEGMRIQGKIPFASLDVEDTEQIQCPNPLKFALHISPVQNGVLVQGQLQTTLICRCDRCLENFNLPVVTDEVCHFFEEVHTTELDLTEDIREDILLLFPQRAFCRADCRGICPNCGQNLNVSECRCPPTHGGSDAWSILDNIDLPPEGDD